MLNAVGYTASDDDQILEDHRRRRLVELFSGHFVWESLGQDDLTVIAERRHELAALGVDRVELVATIEEDAHVLTVTMDRNAAVLEATRRCPARPALVRPRVERPELRPRSRIQGDHARVHRGDIQGVVDHQRGHLEAPGPGAVFLERKFAGFPLPGDLELVDVLQRDLRGG